MDVDGSRRNIRSENPTTYQVEGTACGANVFGVCDDRCEDQCHLGGATDEELRRTTGVASAQIAECVIASWETTIFRTGGV